MTKETNSLLSDYELDKDIPESIWNNYLKKYKDDYILFLGGERIWKIKCRFGQIEPYSLKKGYLSFYAKFPSPNKKTYFLKRIPTEIEVTQSSDDECVIKFAEANLASYITLFTIKQRRHLSEATKEKLRENIKKALTFKHIKKANENDKSLSKSDTF